MNCIFCDMAKKTIPVTPRYESSDILAFDDINPAAPTHIIIIPKKHLATLNELNSEDTLLMGNLTLVATKLAAEQGCSENGYRLVMNCNSHGGQSVYHIHLHLLAGRQFQWPPG